MGYVGFTLGLSSELVKLTGVIGGFFLSFQYYQIVGDAFSSRTPLSVEWAGALVMVGLFVVGYLLLTKVLRLLEKLMQMTFQPTLSKVGGLLAGVFRAVLVTSVVLVVCQQLPSSYLNAAIEEHSLSGQTISRVTPALYDAVSPIMVNFLKSLRPRSE